MLELRISIVPLKSGEQNSFLVLRDEVLNQPKSFRSSVCPEIRQVRRGRRTTVDERQIQDLQTLKWNGATFILQYFIYCISVLIKQPQQEAVDSSDYFNGKKWLLDQDEAAWSFEANDVLREHFRKPRPTKPRPRRRWRSMNGLAKVGCPPDRRNDWKSRKDLRKMRRSSDLHYRQANTESENFKIFC